METTRYTLEALADEVNGRSGALNMTPQDQRTQPVLSARRIRDYQSKGLIEKPVRDGKHTFYTEKHVTQLLALRSLQSEGLSERYITEQLDLKDESLVNSYLLQKSGTPPPAPIATSGFMARPMMDGAKMDDASFSRFYEGSPDASPSLTSSFISGDVDFVMANSTPTPNLFTAQGHNPALNAIHLIRATLPKTLSGSLRKSNSGVAGSQWLTQNAANPPKTGNIPSHPLSCREWTMAQGRLRVSLIEGPPLTPDEQKQALQHMQQILDNPDSHK